MSAPDVAEWLADLRALHADLLSIGSESPSYGPCFVDPRQFTPDPECSTEAERALHRADCERLARGEPVSTETRCQFRNHGTGVTSVTMPSGYGLGINLADGDPQAADAAERLGRVVDSIERWFSEEYQP